MMLRSFCLSALSGFSAAVWAMGCGSASDSPSDPLPAFGVTQGGARDIGRFRSLVDAQQVPPVNLLDAVGFFAEHALPQPAADCGDSVCFHPNLAVAPRFDGSNWTMAFVSMNTSVTPSTVARPPTHWVVLAELSSAIASVDSDMFTEGYSNALAALKRELKAADRVSLVLFAWVPEVRRRAAHPYDVSLTTELENAAFPPHTVSTAGRTSVAVDLYSGLATAFELAESDAVRPGRVLLVTSGNANVGITDPDRIVELAEAHVARGTPVSVVGVGDPFRDDIVRRISDLGAGSYGYAETPDDLVELVIGDARTHLVPLARQASLRVSPEPGYRVGRIYGARRAVREGTDVVLETPALFVGLRTSEGETTLGRRGGGGGLFVELIADADAKTPPGSPAYRLQTSYTDASTGAQVLREHAVVNALAPGENPPGMWPEFTDADHAKAFMMLNLYLALRATVVLFDEGDCGAGLGVSEMMGPSVEAWQSRFTDPDIDADWQLLQRLKLAIDAQCTASPIEPREFDGGCFFVL